MTAEEKRKQDEEYFVARFNGPPAGWKPPKKEKSDAKKEVGDANQLA